jgi:hypothetical protein
MIAGDFNFPHLTWSIKQQPENTSSNSLFADLIMNSNLQQLILEPTRYRCGQRPSLLDLLLCNENNLIYDINLTSPIGKSDHVVIEYKLQLLIDNKPKQFLKHLNIINYTNLKERLNSTDWSLVFDADDLLGITSTTYYHQQSLKKLLLKWSRSTLLIPGYLLIYVVVLK